jgi:hypothetical protein
LRSPRGLVAFELLLRVAQSIERLAACAPPSLEPFAAARFIASAASALAHRVVQLLPLLVARELQQLPAPRPLRERALVGAGLPDELPPDCAMRR